MKRLERVLTASDAGWIVAGSMIGSGIFITPGVVAGLLPGAVWPLLAWTLGGLLALAGAAVYGELGSRFPRAGGDYQYLTEAFGPLWGFVNGWAAITLTFSAAAALQCHAAMSYLNQALPGLERTPFGVGAVGAPILIVLLTWANTIGARTAGKTTLALTAIPIAMLAGLFAYGALTGTVALSWPAGAAAPPNWPVLLGAAMIPVFFTYSGWNAAAYLAGEMKDAGRSLARGLLAGTGLVTCLYLIVNLGLLLLVPQEVLAGSTNAGAEAARRLLGGGAERALAGLIAIAILGSANVTLMAGSRIYYAMAVDGLAPSALARVGRTGVPTVALWVGGGWTAVLAIVGDIGVLLNWATLAILLLSSMTVVSLFVFRRRDPRGTAFRCPGYPVTPWIYLIASLGVATATTFSAPLNAGLGLLLLAAGVPAYHLARRWFRHRES